MALFKGLTFDGVNSTDYGIYLTGAGVYNAPERVVDMVSVAGRNGDLAIDQGRYTNIEVTYAAGCFAQTQAEYAEKVSAFRNILASRYNYVRLTDGYNANEHRLALYKSGLEVNAVNSGRAGEFDIVFECKPQRFLASGETVVTFTTNGQIVNETPYDANPLIVVEGYGAVGIGSVTITITGSSSTVTYIDCDLMECYRYSGSAIVPAGSAVTFSGLDFPTLPADKTTNITKSSTVSNVKITPRWWIL